MSARRLRGRETRRSGGAAGLHLSHPLQCSGARATARKSSRYRWRSPFPLARRAKRGEKPGPCAESGPVGWTQARARPPSGGPQRREPPRIQHRPPPRVERGGSVRLRRPGAVRQPEERVKRRPIAFSPRIGRPLPLSHMRLKRAHAAHRSSMCRARRVRARSWRAAGPRSFRRCSPGRVISPHTCLHVAHAKRTRDARGSSAGSNSRAVDSTSLPSMGCCGFEVDGPLPEAVLTAGPGAAGAACAAARRGCGANQLGDSERLGDVSSGRAITPHLCRLLLWPTAPDWCIGIFVPQRADHFGAGHLAHQ